MATWYVSISTGNDANDGLAWATAKATIGAAVTASASDDTINIGEGVYKEFVSTTKTGLTLQGFGYVVVDGENARSLINGTYAPGMKLYDLGFRDSIGGRVVRLPFPTVVRCRFYNIIGGSLPPSDAYNSGISFEYGAVVTDCVFANCKNVGFPVSETGTKSILRNTWDSNCLVHMANISASSTIQFIDNIVSCPFYAWASYYGTLDYNDYYGSIYAWISGAWVLKTFGEWQTYTGKDAHSLNVLPQFLDETYNDLFLKSASLLKTASSTGIQMGWGRVGHHTNVLSTESQAATLTNVHIDDDGYYVLDAGQPNGTVLFDVIDLGASYNIRRLMWQATEDPWRSVIDSDDTTGTPLYKTIEYRYKTTSFLKGDALPAWNTAYNLQDINVTGRYFQWRVRLTTTSGP
jgi:hypothetical protein